MRDEDARCPKNPEHPLLEAHHVRFCHGPTSAKRAEGEGEGEDVLQFPDPVAGSCAARQQPEDTARYRRAVPALVFDLIVLEAAVSTPAGRT